MHSLIKTKALIIIERQVMSYKSCLCLIYQFNQQYSRLAHIIIWSFQLQLKEGKHFEDYEDWRKMLQQ